MADNLYSRIEKSKPDYFSSFMSLRIGFNSWYNTHYISSWNWDRNKINALKSDFSDYNPLFLRYKNFVDTKDIEFRNNFSWLYNILEDVLIYNEKNWTEWKPVNFSFFWQGVFFKKSELTPINYTEEERQATNVQFIIALGMNFVEVENNEVHFFTDNIYIKSSKEYEAFSIIIEIMYQVRCILFHGDMDITDPKFYNISKYCYNLLNSFIT